MEALVNSEEDGEGGGGRKRFPPFKRATVGVATILGPEIFPSCSPHPSP